MDSHVKIRRADGTWVVRAGGAVLGESANAIELTEGDNVPVIYFPREDLAMAFLEPSATTGHSPAIGDSRFFTIHAKSGPIEDAAWSYETPKDGLEDIAGHMAFYPQRVAVERL